jgi:hypothetical protein
MDTACNGIAALRLTDPSLCNEADLLHLLSQDELTAVCLQLDLRSLVRIAETCKCFRYGDAGLETEELPTKSPVITALRERAFPGGEIASSMRPIGCSESWMAYLARRVRQRRCWEAPPIAAGRNSQRLCRCGRTAADIRWGARSGPR